LRPIRPHSNVAPNLSIEGTCSGLRPPRPSCQTLGLFIPAVTVRPLHSHKRKRPLVNQVTVRSVAGEDFEAWRVLWNGYNAFYGRSGSTALGQPMNTALASPLKKELQTFERMKEKLTKSSLGRIVVIHEDELVGVYNSEDEALAEGARRFSTQPFLVSRIQLNEDEVCILALALGILRADLPSTVRV